MLLKMVLDCREQKLIEIFPDTETKQLDIGDILYVDSENSDIKCIVERKTLNDLSSSIIDGRYKEQKSR
jgi:ERCC4-type nuclease